jgi:glycosyltransferase involved in cell wall biosynthesis
MSGVALDLFRGLDCVPPLKILHRTSVHIRVQRDLLDAEALRAAAKWIDRPSDWIIDREEDEYRRADLIHVLSRFALGTFPEAESQPEKFDILKFGVDVSRFRATPAALSTRLARVAAGEPLRVLNVGTFCLRKGAAVWAEALARPDPPPYRVRFVGPVSADAVRIAHDLAMAGRAEFRTKVPQNELPAEYEWGDVFALPTIEDGFPMVFNQALAGGLPLITTPNCCGPDIVREGENGWIIAPQSSAALHNRLTAVAADRAGLALAIRTTQSEVVDYDWAVMARQFIASSLAALVRRGMFPLGLGRPEEEGDARWAGCGPGT